MSIFPRFFLTSLLALAGAIGAVAQDDPFNANAYRVERDNLAEKNAAAEAGAIGAVAKNKAQPPIGAVGADAVAPRHFPWYRTEAFNDGWEYLEKNLPTPEAATAATGWVPVTLPHSWNAKDTIEKADYRRDVSWYRKVFNFDDPKLRYAKNLYLRFGAAGQSATVYINGTERITHHGGYSAFIVELPERQRTRGDYFDTDASKLDYAENFSLHSDAAGQSGTKRTTRHGGLTIFRKYGNVTVLVRVSNERNRHLPPLSGDFNQYGGLYRQVHLIKTFGQDSFSRAALPVIKSETTAATARFEVPPIAIKDATSGRLDTLKVELTITAPDGTEVAKISSKADAPLIGAVEKPLLWSPETPNLYTFTFRLIPDSTSRASVRTVVDEITLRHGFRWFEFTPDKGFFLNGKPCKLVGISRHQDRPGFGPALSDAQHDADLRRIKELGFNFLRLAHYQQDDYVLQRCDELGLLVWEEIPLVNVIAPRAYPPSEILAANATSMLTDMVTQHRHHPAIIIWGLGNEISYSTPDENAEQNAFELGLIRDLNTLAHRLDPTRRTIIVSHDSDRAADIGIMAIPDLNGYNLYRGWYRPDPATLPARLNELRAKNPTKPLFLSEFGAGADPWIHSETPRRFDYTEEHMVNTLDATYDLFDKELSWLAGHNLWVFADFGAAHRVDTHPYINNKGLLDMNRQPKDAFYQLKARLQKTDPVLYLQSPSWTTRGGTAQKTYRAFSNMDAVEFFHDGVSLGVQKKDFRWNVVLRAGANALLVKGVNADGTAREHGFTVNYDPARAAQIAPIIPKK